MHGILFVYFTFDVSFSNTNNVSLMLLRHQGYNSSLCSTAASAAPLGVLPPVTARLARVPRTACPPSLHYCTPHSAATASAQEGGSTPVYSYINLSLNSLFVHYLTATIQINSCR